MATTTPRKLLIYGATGYTGELVAAEAVARGLDPILAGRNHSRLAKLSRRLGCEFRVCDLSPEALDREIRAVSVVLNLAGPFSATATPLVDVCLRRGIHYLDITGELAVVQRLWRRDDEASKAGAMVMPGVGYIVVATDCLAAHVARAVPDARTLRIAVSHARQLSRGSARTMIELVSSGVQVRKNGKLCSIPAGRLDRWFDFGDGRRHTTAVSWPDVETAFHSTGIPNIESYLELQPAEKLWFVMNSRISWLLRSRPWQMALKAQTALLPEGPSEARRAATHRVVVAEAEKDGERAGARLRTPESYSLTATASVAIAARALDGDVEPGVRTPAQVYGADFVLGLDGVERHDFAS